jgi:hypothetical protein
MAARGWRRGAAWLATEQHSLVPMREATVQQRLQPDAQSSEPTTQPRRVPCARAHANGILPVEWRAANWHDYAVPSRAPIWIYCFIDPPTPLCVLPQSRCILRRSCADFGPKACSDGEPDSRPCRRRGQNWRLTAAVMVEAMEQRRVGTSSGDTYRTVFYLQRRNRRWPCAI